MPEPKQRGRPKKVVTEFVEQPKQKKEPKPGYNEFGVCIACQGGYEGCKHNNLVEDGQRLLCVTCGKDMKCD